jgi:hypothetical protein
MEGPIIGEGFVKRDDDGVIRGVGKWCGFPFVIELRAGTSGAHKGYKLILQAAPQPGIDPLVDDLLCLPYQITQPLARKR